LYRFGSRDPRFRLDAPFGASNIVNKPDHAGEF
jgi:hypothetical protein